ncbi:hypothetical protein F443_04640 [Phytophthora nicotianae P1569]|uniref:Uncharacterized protein n=1 Tax=Phytophthora nicotianae P1569 TaxID=1317065 RepID=V9FL03_PHYNI|nr:hypothetical protein F443_04640 [Phytophthora nicotianae P1569]
MTPREYKSCDKEFVLLELYPMCTYVDYPGQVTEFLDVTLDAAKAKAAITTLKRSGTWVNYHSRQLAITLATYSGELRTPSQTTEAERGSPSSLLLELT